MRRIQIQFISINKKTLYFYEIFLKKIFKKFSIKYSLFKLPLIKTKISLLKSPHVYKKAWEHFEIRKYKLVYYIYDLKKNNNLLFLILKNKINSINIKIKTF